MNKVPALFKEEPAKLIVNRRAIAAGLAALIGAPVAAAKTLEQLSNVPLTFDAGAFSGMMEGGLFLPDYRWPMCRLVFSDGSHTAWNAYHGHSPGSTKKVAYTTGAGMTRSAGSTPAFIEVCCPDKNGAPRYTQLAIG